MSNANIEVRPVTPTIGAEIFGTDIGQKLGNQTYQEIHDALMEHQVVFFRDQKLDLDQHKAFGKRFGELAIHADVSCVEEPPMGSVLHMHTVPPFGGDTLFASMSAANDALSERMKTYLDGLDRNPRRRAHLARPLQRPRH